MLRVFPKIAPLALMFLEAVTLVWLSIFVCTVNDPVLAKTVKLELIWLLAVICLTIKSFIVASPPIVKVDVELPDIFPDAVTLAVFMFVPADITNPVKFEPSP